MGNAAALSGGVHVSQPQVRILVQPRTSDDVANQIDKEQENSDKVYDIVKHII